MIIRRLGGESSNMMRHDVIVLDDDTSDSEAEAPSSYAQDVSAYRAPSRESSAASAPAEAQPTPGFSNSTAYMDAVRTALAMAAALDKKDGAKKQKPRVINKPKQPRKQAAPPPPRPFSETAERYKSSKSRAWVKKRERPRSVPFKTHAVSQQREYGRAPELKRVIPIDVTSSTSASSSGSLSGSSSSSLSSDSESSRSASSLSATAALLAARQMKRKRKLLPKPPHKSYRPVPESKSVDQQRKLFKNIRLDRPRAVEDLMLKGLRLNSGGLKKSQSSAPVQQVWRPPPSNSYAVPKSDKAPLVARKQLMSEYKSHSLSKNVMTSLPSKPAAQLSSESKRVENKEKLFSRLKKYSNAAPKSDIPSRKNFVILSSSSLESESTSSISSDEQDNTRAKRVRKTLFHTDHVALNEVQAQERELARFQAQKKQDLESCTASFKNPRSKPSTVYKAAEPPCPRVEEKHDAVIDLDSDVDMSDGTTMDIHLKVQAPPAAPKPTPKRSIALKNVCHSTAFRRIYFDEAPSNILLADSSDCRLPYAFQSDHRLTSYDETKTLNAKCKFLSSFGKAKRFIPSAFDNSQDQEFSQEEINVRVKELVDEELPTIRSCRQRMVTSILTESRADVSACLTALRKRYQTECEHQVIFQRRLKVSKVEKAHAKQTSRCTRMSSMKDLAYLVGRGDANCKEYPREYPMKCVVQMASCQYLATSTTCIGVRVNIRVEDDPILRFASTSRDQLGDKTASLVRNDTAQPKSDCPNGAIEEEVYEYVLRLVIAQCGDSEQVFRALKSMLGYSQAYTDYNELKKLSDARRMTRRRLQDVKNLISGLETCRQKALMKLVKSNQWLSRLINRYQSLAERLAPPPTYFESHFAENTGNSAGAADQDHAYGIRATSDYGEMAETYRDLFCRMCYVYNCEEHSIEQVMPARRVDPIYPALKNSTKSSSMDAYSIDQTEYIDATHTEMVASVLKKLASPDTPCSTACWKSTSSSSVQVTPLSQAEILLIKKIGHTMGDIPCLTACFIQWVSCKTIHEFYERSHMTARGRNDSMDDSVLSGGVGSKKRNWKHGRVGSNRWGSNRELLKRTRNKRLHDKGNDHQYQPCNHDGVCDSIGCSCMTRDHMCEKACSCSRDCPNRFEGCRCEPGRCRTESCACVAALRECNPDLCTSCGVADAAVALRSSSDSEHPPIRINSLCGNFHITRRAHKKIGVRHSATHGWGAFALENIQKGDFVYEYTGALISHDEAERRGALYTNRTLNFLFDLNDDVVVDAVRKGNKSKFINHRLGEPNCLAKEVLRAGMHHITIWALKSIRKHDELTFNYGYFGDAAPDWSQFRTVGSK